MIAAFLRKIFLTTLLRHNIQAQGINVNIMKTIIKELLFDKELVNRIKEVKTNKGVLYHHLISGRITLGEYLAAL